MRAKQRRFSDSKVSPRKIRRAFPLSRNSDGRRFTLIAYGSTPGRPLGCLEARARSQGRELSRLFEGNTYFLSCRDAAAACPGLSPQTAHNIAGALARLCVIKIVSKGKAGLNSAKAAEFQYLLPETDNTAEEEEDSRLDL